MSLNSTEHQKLPQHTLLGQFVQVEVLTSALIVLIFIRYAQKKLAKDKSWIDSLPGPPQLPLLGGLHYFTDLSQSFKIIAQWSAKYGPVFRSNGIFGEPYVFLTDPSHVQAVLSSNHLGLVSKPSNPYDKVFGQFLKNGLLISKGEYWKSHRKIASRAFTYKSFYEYTKLFNQYSKRLVNDLGKLFSQDEEPHQISSLIHCCSLHILCACAMEFDLSSGEDGKTFYELTQRYKIISSKRAMNPLFLINMFWRLLPISREYDNIIDSLNNITDKIIDNHIKAKQKEAQCTIKVVSSQENDVMGIKPYRSMIDEMLASEMTKEEILIEVNTVILAGFESTSLTVQYLLFLLALNPDHQKICRKEVDEMFNDPVMCHNGNLSADAICKLKYLERCCMETLRLFPVIFLFQRQPEVSVQLDNETIIPPGTNVIIPTIVIHKSSKYYTNPEKFEPDRFSPENCKQRHPYAYLPFSAGIRNCIGMKFAMMEIKVITAHVLRHFDVSSTDNIDDVPLLPSIVMTPERDYNFVLKRRTVS